MRRLKAAGAIVLAKTNTPEFAAGANTNNALFGPTRNPWNPALSPAGSSGGSAVAVATGMLPIAQGTDFGCSIRIPAAFCGIVGIRANARPDAELSDAACVGSRPGARAAGARCRGCSPDARRHDRLSAVFRRSRSRRRGRARSPNSIGATTSRACASPTCPTLPASAWKRRSTRSCRDAAAALGKLGAHVDQIEFDVSDGRAPYQTWRGFWMVGQQVRATRADR